MKNPYTLSRVVRTLLLVSFLIAVSIAQLRAQTGVCFTVPDENLYTAGSTFVTHGDFNNDGIVDLASSSSSVYVYIQLGTGTGVFGAATSLIVESVPRNIVVKDFNDDGDEDIAVINQGSNSVSILLGDGTGAFASAVNYAVGTSPVGLVSGDFDGDDDMDLAAANSSPSNSVSVLLGNGNGTFAAAVDYPTTSPFLRAITMGDFDEDGKLDVMAGGIGGVFLMLGVGNGTFTAAPANNVGSIRVMITDDFNEDGHADVAIDKTSGATPIQILTGDGDGAFAAGVSLGAGTGLTPAYLISNDINNDGHMDIVSATQGSSPGATSWLGDGAGSFTAAINVYVSTQNPQTVTAADFNDDGKSDLAISVFPGVAITIGNGAGTFATTTPRLLVGASYGIVHGDFNNDLKEDFAVTVQSTNFIHTFLGNGSGGFTLKGSTATGTAPWVVDSGDFDDDGKIDLAVVNNQGNSISVLIGNGDGTFDPAVNYTVGFAPSSLVTSDFNGDEVIDLAVTIGGDNKVQILIGAGDGTFVAGDNFDTGNFPRSIIAADLNNDTNVDLAIANQNTFNVSILLGDGAGSFEVADPTETVAGFVNSLTSADFNDDGIADIVVGGGSSAAYLEGNGDGTFAGVLYFPAGALTTSVENGDFNRDGNIDLALADYGNTNANVAVLIGDGAGGFAAPVLFYAGAAGAGPTGVLAADFNNDESLDLLVNHYGINDVYVYLNNTAHITPDGPTAFCPGDDVTLSASANALNTYSWSPGGATTHDLTVSSSGAYAVTITNLKGTCSSTSNAIAVVADGPTTPVVTPTQPSCSVSTGTLTVTVQNASDTYSFDNGANYQSGNAKSGLAADNYDVKVKNAAGCISVATVATIDTAPVAPTTPVAAVTQPTCSVATGTITVTVQNATDTYSFDNGANFQASNVKSGLAVGGYNVVIKNLTGCSSTPTAKTVNAQPAIPALPVATVTQPTCSVSQGSITVTVQNGGDAYSFDNGSNFQVSNVKTLLAPGNYNVVIRNTALCTSAPSAVTVNVQPSTPLTPDATVTSQPTCAVPTGTINVTVQEATETYSFDNSVTFQANHIGSGLAPGNHSIIIKNAAGCSSPATSKTVNAPPPSPSTPVLTVTQPTCQVPTGTITITIANQSPADGYSFDGGITFQGGLVKSGLAPGSYQVIVDRGNGCTSTATTTVDPLPPGPASPVVTVTQPTCTVATGAISVAVQDAGDTYSFNNGTNFQAGNSKSDLAAGNYDVVVKNADGCSTTVAVVVNAQPATPANPVTTVTQPTCSTATGTVTITVQNASDTYSFDGGVNFQASNSKPGLAVGSHSVVIKSAAGCSSPTSTATVNAAPALPAIPVATVTQPTCSVATGTISVAVQNAADTYSFDNGANFQSANAKSGLAAGSHTIVIKNAAGCTSTSSSTINVQPVAPSKPTITASGENSEVLTATEAAAYQWYNNDVVINGSTARSFTVTAAGSYSVVVFSAGGCASVASDKKVMIVTGLGDGPADVGLRLYPNPAADWLTVTLTPGTGEKRVTIYQMSGVAVASQQVADREARFYVADYSSGIYLVKVQISNTVKTVRFVKQ